MIERALDGIVGPHALKEGLAVAARLVGRWAVSCTPEQLRGEGLTSVRHRNLAVDDSPACTFE